MKRLRTLWFLLLLTLLSISVRSQNIPQTGILHQGTDFWLAWMVSYDFDGLSEREHRLHFCADQTCTVHIENPRMNWDTTIWVAPTGVNTLCLRHDLCHHDSMETPQDHGFHITSSDTIAVYMGSYAVGTTDATAVIPTNMLRSEYMLSNFPPKIEKRDPFDNQDSINDPDYRRSFGEDVSPQEYVIVATQDSTHVTIYLTDTIDDGSYFPGIPIQVMLHRGQSYVLRGRRVTVNNHQYLATPCDLSGSLVMSDSCKPIAVFAGMPCVTIPATAYACDHILTQLYPVDFWGTEFLVPNIPEAAFDYVCFTARTPNTTIYHNGTLLCTVPMSNIMGRTWMHIALPSEGPHHYTSNHPVQVIRYAIGGSVDGSSADGFHDPSMTVCPPVEQMSYRVDFHSYRGDLPYNQRINYFIWCPTADADGLLVDGNPVTGLAPVTSMPGYSAGYCQQLGEGRHSVYHTGNGKFGGILVGRRSYESYSFIPAQKSPSGADIYPGSGTFCVYDSLTLLLEPKNDPESCRWEWPDGTVQYGYSHHMMPPDTGSFDVMAIVTYPDRGCYTQIPDTHHVHLRFVGNVRDTVDRVQCQGPFLFLGEEYNVGDYVLERQGPGQSCDSVIRLHFAEANVHENVTDTVRQEDLPHEYHGVTFYRDSTATINIPGVISVGDTLLCDSIVFYRLVVLHAPIDPPTDTIYPPTDTIFPPTDPIVTIEDTMTLWVPNAFTPDENNNNLFRIFGYGIEEVEVLIFDRRGLEIARMEGLDDCWDGTSHGRPMPQGAYVYLVRYRTVRDSSYWHHKTGTILLLR